MKIINKKLLSVEEADLVNGVFVNKEVTEVADECFIKMPGLKKVILPKVKKIGNNCFSFNGSLTEIKLEALTTCGSYCFSSNGSLTEIKLNKNLTVKNVDGY